MSKASVEECKISNCQISIALVEHQQSNLVSSPSLPLVHRKPAPSLNKDGACFLAPRTTDSLLCHTPGKACARKNLESRSSTRCARDNGNCFWEMEMVIPSLENGVGFLDRNNEGGHLETADDRYLTRRGRLNRIVPRFRSCRGRVRRASRKSSRLKISKSENIDVGFK